MFLFVFLMLMTLNIGQKVFGNKNGSLRNVEMLKTHDETVRIKVSEILNELLTGYDMRLRPDFNGKTTVIQTDINIRSMGPISEVDMTYSLDCYFRQTWQDTRLRFNMTFGKQFLVLSVRMLDRIWKPDTYFANGRGSYLHTLTVPNKLIRLYPNGTILYSMRLSIKANCPMFLRYFPIDEQICPLSFGSYGYSTKDIMYSWKYGLKTSVMISDDVRLSQFSLTRHPLHNNTQTNSRGSFSVLMVEFHLVRHMGFFLIQIYVPCTLLVVLSWVSFWLNREATADRIGLGVTTVLTLTTLAMDSRDDLPRVPYATALDWFIITCYSFIIGSIFEFALIHFFTKFDSGEIPFDPDVDGESSQFYEEYELNSMDSKPFEMEPTLNSHCLTLNSEVRELATHSDDFSESLQQNVTCPKTPPNRNQRLWMISCFLNCLQCIRGNANYRGILNKMGNIGVNSVSVIDRAARLLFPSTFLLINVFYWISYTKTNQSNYRNNL